jgi:hypothetical protein
MEVINNAREAPRAEEVIDEPDDVGDDAGFCEDLSETEEDDESLTASFARWLAEKHPLFRFEHAARGMAWDYPLAKAEKKELLILHFSVAEQQAAYQEGTEKTRITRCSLTGSSL